ncbi:hypothetical protein DFH07DRAFT_781596 [Mycena maculata]|uniref:Uncharacterized protein n=1 Tax=Mycena maculata TaxID=230809 RepID=A0AAD7MSW3_9AGAR|nr:hypothetical protein DFH07DRAFT_781596 [Mycena maculata]
MSAFESNFWNLKDVHNPLSLIIQSQNNTPQEDRLMKGTDTAPINDEPTGATSSQAPSVISVTQSEDFLATINIAPSAFAMLPPTVGTPAPALTPAAPHPTLGLTPTTAFEQSRSWWLPDYSIDGRAYLRWNDSDFEVDPFF